MSNIPSVTDTVSFNFETSRVSVHHEISDKTEGFMHRVTVYDMDGICSEGDWVGYNSFAEVSTMGMRFLASMDSWRGQFPEVFQVVEGTKT